MPYGEILSDKITTSDGVSSAGVYGLKNRLINGSMSISQGAAGATITPAVTSAYATNYPVDRFQVIVGAASKLTTIMVHEASAEIFGKTADIKANADHIDELEEDFYRMMAAKTKHNEEFWKKACRKDYYMSAAKALELGLIDQII